MVKRPLVIVEEAFEMKPLVKVAVVEKKFVDVPEVSESVPRVVRPVMFKVGACKPLKSVEVALATKLPTFWIESREPGVEVPIPTFPFARMVIKVEVDVPPVVEAMVKSGVLAAVLAELLMERSE